MWYIRFQQNHWEHACHPSAPSTKPTPLEYPENEQLRWLYLEPTHQTLLIVICLTSFHIVSRRNMTLKQWNYTTCRLCVILEGSNMLHKVCFLSKVLCLSIILSFRISIMLSVEEHRTVVVISFMFKHKGDCVGILPGGIIFLIEQSF